MVANYYSNLRIQPIELILAFGMDFPDGNILKFLTRYCVSGDLNDLNKAIYYCRHSKREVTNPEGLLFAIKLYCLVNDLGDLILTTFTALYDDGDKQMDTSEVISRLQAVMNRSSAEKMISLLHHPDEVLEQ